MQLPTGHEIRTLHQMYAPGETVFQRVWEHSQIVAAIVRQLSGAQDIDTKLAECGALVHDIGVYRLYTNGVPDSSQHYITHGLLGYELLQDEGFDEALCRFALLHTGVGITKEDVEEQNLPIPARDYVAETAEERLVMYADKFHSKQQPPTFNSATWYRNYLLAKFGEHKAQTFDELVNEFGVPHMQPLIDEYGHGLRQL